MVSVKDDKKINKEDFIQCSDADSIGRTSALHNIERGEYDGS